MPPTVSELMRALPEVDETQEAREPLAGATMRPVPVGRWRRLRLLATLQAKIGAAYLFYWIRGWFQNADQREKTLAEAHWQTAAQLLDSMGYLRGAVMKPALHASLRAHELWRALHALPAQGQDRYSPDCRRGSQSDWLGPERLRLNASDDGKYHYLHCEGNAVMLRRLILARIAAAAKAPGVPLEYCRFIRLGRFDNRRRPGARSARRRNAPERLPGPSPAGILALMSDVTRILSAIEQGDPHAAEQLLPLVYGELRKLAAQRLAQEKPGQTLQATALVHDAYIRLVDAEQARHWNSRGHFFAAAAEAMRRILVDQARRKQADKHGGGRLRVDLPQDLAAPTPRSDALVALDEALSRLERHDADAARLVKLRYFAGLSHQDAAEALGISRGAADRLWALARAWLFRQLSK
jgi:RNA polymerase sigma factor (TIGR02999 family)